MPYFFGSLNDFVIGGTQVEIGTCKYTTEFSLNISGRTVIHFSLSIQIFKFQLLIHLSTIQKQPPDVFYEKRCSQKFCKILLQHDSIRLRSATLLKKKLWHRCFPVNFAKFLRTPVLKNICEQLLLTIWKLFSKTYKVESF